MVATDVMTLSPLLPSLTASNTALAYNPSVSPFVYAMLSGFAGTSSSGLSETMLYILDPATGYSIVNDINLSAVPQVPASRFRPEQLTLRESCP